MYCQQIMCPRKAWQFPPILVPEGYQRKIFWGTFHITFKIMRWRSFAAEVINYDEIPTVTKVGMLGFWPFGSFPRLDALPMPWFGFGRNTFGNSTERVK